LNISDFMPGRVVDVKNEKKLKFVQLPAQNTCRDKEDNPKL